MRERPARSPPDLTNPAERFMENDEKLTKVHVGFANGGGESMWAREIEGDLFAIKNLPFFAFGLNFEDVVRATPGDSGLREVRTVVRRSGHQTLRMLFPPHVRRADQQVHLDAVKCLGASFERATDRLVAVDVPPGASYDAILALLTNLEAADVAAFETCEARRVDDFGVEDQDVAA
jgi:hypothetical protein